MSYVYFSCLGKTATKPQRRKFGLAWLFSYEDEENDKDKSQQELQAAMDERIRGTRITLEVTKKEQRIEVEGNGQFLPWKYIDWNYTNCSQIPTIPTTVVQSEFVTTAISNTEYVCNSNTYKYMKSALLVQYLKL